MRCLWLTRQQPRPANSGELIYSRGLILSLAASGANLTLLTYDGQQSPTEPLRSDQPIRQLSVGPMPPRGIRNLLSTLPSDASRLRSGALLREFRKQLQGHQYDAVIVDQAALGWAVEEIQRSSQRPTIVYVSHNREAEIRPQIALQCREHLIKRAAMRYDARKYGQLERQLCRAADLITAITPEDRQYYADEYPGTPVIELLPGYEHPVATPHPRPLSPDIPRRVLLIGSFEWIAKRQNLDAFLSVAAPAFQRANIELRVVGKAHEDYVQEVTRRFAGVSFEANVPSIEPYLADARLGLVADSAGGGFKLKTLDYAFGRLPMAALKDALGGVDLRPNHDAIIEDSIPTLVDAIVERIDDFDFLNAAAERTYARFKDRFRWKDRGRALLQSLESVLATGAEDHAFTRADDARHDH